MSTKTNTETTEESTPGRKPFVAPEGFITVTEAARRASIRPQMVYNYLGKGKFEGHEVTDEAGTTHRVLSVASFDAWHAGYLARAQERLERLQAQLKG